jgi:hypothetical protein
MREGGERESMRERGERETTTTTEEWSQREKEWKQQFNRRLGAIKIPDKKDFKTEFKQIPLLTQDPQEFKLSK